MNEKIFIRPSQIGSVVPQSNPVRQQPSGGTSFETVFQDQLKDATDLRFSAHALKRMESRQITFNSQELEQLKDAVNRADAKGAKESLILMDKLALVVSVKNRTVITAVDDSSLKDNVFTNIDSAIILKS